MIKLDKYYKFKNIETEEFENLKWLQINKEDDIFLQRSVDEYEKLKEYIKNPSNIVDLGCGLGRSSIFFKNMTPSLNDTKFYMCDFTGLDFKTKGSGNKNCGMRESTNKIPYNDMDITKEFCITNNLENIDLVNLDTDRISKLNNIDLVYSFHCVGYHWGIEESFLKYNLENSTNENAILIFGVRKNGKKLKEPSNLGSFELVEKVDGFQLSDYLIYENVI
tara:strand:+ start:5071 stop:5733 length:663 start_codon:yes stop_codon:yes gene_type:complete